MPKAPPPPGEAAAWCKDAGQSVSKSDVSFDEDYKDIEIVKEESPRLWNTATRLARMYCTTGQVTGRDKILAMRDRWMKLNDLDEGDFIVLVTYGNRYSYDSQDIEKIPGPTSQIERTGYSHSAFAEADTHGSKLSMFGRFTLVSRCKSSGSQGGLLHDVLCTREPLNVAKADAEIDGIKELNLGTRYELRKMVREAAKWHADKKAELDKKAKDDPGIAKVIAIADETFKEWASPSEKRAKLMASVEKMEAATKANKYSAFEGCEASTKAAWEEHLASLKLPKVPSKGVLNVFIEATLTNAEGYLAYEALRLCSAGTEENFHKGFDFIGADVIRRGPRTATVAAWLGAAGQIKFDDRSLKMKELFEGLPRSEGSRWEDPRQGQIDKLTPFEGGVEISFKKVVEPREDCLKWVETNHIVTFEADGDPIYRRNCVKWGMVKMDLTADPVKVGKVMAKGLKPGMYLFAREGLAIVATANAKSSQAVWVFGGSVK